MDCAEATVGGKPHGHAAGDFPQPTYHEQVSERRKPQGSRARFQEPRGRDERVAPDRHAVPTCRHFGVCGGCSSLDLPIADQLQIKQDSIGQLLAPWLGNVRVECAVPPRTPVHFRTKLLYPVRPDSKGHAILGIYQQKSHELVRIRECQTQDEGLTVLGQRAEDVIRALRLVPWDETTGTGFVRAFHARIAAGTGELLMGIVTRPGLFEQGAEFGARMMEAAADLPGSGSMKIVPVGVVRSISEREGNFLLGERHVPLKGRDHQFDRSGNLTFRIRFGSFYQIHRHAEAVLYRPAMEMAGDVRDQVVVDGYGGIGTFGLRFARAGAARVEVVEENPTACDDARFNAKAHGMPGVRVVNAPFAKAEFVAKPDLLVVDPPRAGLQAEGVARVQAAEPGRILHVACAVDSLARDLEMLCAQGWKVTAMRLCDMFPHTDHVEIVTRLERAKPAA